MKNKVIPSLLVLFIGLSLSPFVQAQGVEQFSTIGKFDTWDYKIEGKTTVLEAPSPTNQYRSEECATYAFANFLNVRNTSRYENPPRLSGEYLFFRKLEAHIDYRLERGFSVFDIEGADPEEPLLIALKYGVVPEESWTPKNPISSFVWNFPKLYKDIDSKLKFWKIELKKTAKQFGKDSQEYVEKLEEAKVDVKSTYTVLSGAMPETFEFRGITTNPLRFFKKFGFSKEAKVYLLVSDRYYEAQTSLLDRKESIDRFRESLKIQTDFVYDIINEEKIPRYISLFLKRGEPTLVSSFWGSGGHMYTILGQELRGEDTYAFKILQSWGRDHGLNGTNWLLKTDVVENADSVFFIQDPN